MHKFTAVLIFVALAIFAAASFGQETDQAALARTIAPYVDGQTLAVFHADIAAFDATGAVDVLAQFLHLGEHDRDRVQGRVVPLSVLVGSLPQGARADVFIVVSVSDLSSVPFFVVLPLEAAVPASAISMELRRHVAADLNREIATEEIGAALVTGSPRTVERLKKAQATKRPEIAAAFEATGESAVQMLFVPSADARRAFEILFPNLPPQLGGGPTKQLTGSVVWMAVGVGFSGEKTAVRVVVQATSAEAATSLADGLTALLKMLAEQPEVREKIPNFDALAKQLAPQTSGDKLTLQLTAGDAEMAGLGSLLLPILRSVEGMIAARVPAGQSPGE